MNNVYANTWATNIGRSPRSEDKPCGPNSQRKISVTLKERAKSASNILGKTCIAGRKEILNADEALTCVQLHRIQVNEENLERDKDGTKSKEKFQKIDVSQNRNHASVNKKIANGRPRTAFARFNLKKCCTSKEHFEFVETSLKVMSISGHALTQSHKLGGESLTDKPAESHYSKDIQRLQNRTSRANSAPPNEFCTSSDTLYNSKRQHFHLPLFWKTRKSYLTKQQNLNKENGQSNVNGNTGTQLRSLLQNKRATSCQQTCPFKCRSCFRACLASDLFMQRQLNLK